MEKNIPVSSRQIEELWNAIEQFEELLSAQASPQAESKTAATGIEALYSRLKSVAWSLQLTPLKDLSRQLQALASETASKLGKTVACEWNAPDVEIGLEARDVLSVLLVHAVRNSVDHGIEDGGAGRIRVRAGIRAGALELSFQDDGRGIDEDRVRARAKTLYGEGVDKEDVLELLFRPGFSTQTEATDFSGRGIGLDAIRSAVRAARGDLIAYRAEPHGFGLALTLPLEVLGTQVCSLEIGSHRFWMDAASFERGDHLHPDENAEATLALSKILGLKAPNSPVYARIKGEDGGFIATVAVDRIGIPQRRFFRRLDPIWRSAGDPALRAWVDASEEMILASRSPSDSAGGVLSILADPSMVQDLLGA